MCLRSAVSHTGARSVCSAPKGRFPFCRCRSCEAPLSLERGASAPLIIAFFLIVVFYAPSLLIGVCAIGCLGLTALRRNCGLRNPLRDGQVPSPTASHKKRQRQRGKRPFGASPQRSAPTPLRILEIRGI